MTPEKYLDLIPNWNRNKPKFSTMIRAFGECFAAQQQTIASLPAAFDLDEAEGAQLDVDGEWIGRSRYVALPLENIWFSFDIEGLGWDQGNWKGPYDLDAGMSRLDDDHYRILLRAKIAANQWDGTLPSAKDALELVFGNGTLVFIQDNFDMSMTFGVAGKIPSAVSLALLAGGYIPLKPEGVKVNYSVISVDNTPLFGFGVENEFIAGWGNGSWGVPPDQVNSD